MAALITINIDPEGDLFLDGTADPSDRRRFRVCSQTLRRHSPVWKRMLFGPWKESKPANSETWVVELPDDPVYPLEIILSIIHGKFDAVSSFLCLQTIHKIFVMANKYDITGITRPWCTQWLHLAHADGDGAHVVKSLYIAWEAGDEKLFAFRLEQIAVNTEIDSNDHLIFAGTIVLDEEEFLGPQTLLGTISEIRLDLIEQLISPVHKILDARMSEHPVCTLESPRTCDDSVIGSIYRQMIQTRGGILPRSPTQIKDSVVSLASWIFSMMKNVAGTHQPSSKTVPSCCPQKKFRKLNRSIHDGIQEVVDDCMKPSYKDYMAKQRKKTGFSLMDWPSRDSTSRYWKEY